MIRRFRARIAADLERRADAHIDYVYDIVETIRRDLGIGWLEAQLIAEGKFAYVRLAIELDRLDRALADLIRP